MTHEEIIKDTDEFFDIDPITRVIMNNTPNKTTIMQYDHNSERFTFSMPRFVESHDMLSCKVSVHYINVASQTNEQILGRYDVDDLQIHSEDDLKVVFSWLISSNVTQKAGLVQFSIRFVCENEDGLIDYAWSTNIFKNISVSWSIYNSEAIAERHADVLDAWKKDIDVQINEANGYIKEIDSMIGDIGTALDEIIALQKEYIGAKIITKHYVESVLFESINISNNATYCFTMNYNTCEADCPNMYTQAEIDEYTATGDGYFGAYINYEVYDTNWNLVYSGIGGMGTELGGWGYFDEIPDGLALDTAYYIVRADEQVQVNTELPTHDFIVEG